MRSIFQHFADLETLHAAVAERLVERVSALVLAVPSELPLDERLDRLVRQRCALLEAVTPIRRAAGVHGPFSEEITARLRAGQAFLREEAETTFAPELNGDPDRLDALDAALSWATWEGLRAGLGRSAPDALDRRPILPIQMPLTAFGACAATSCDCVHAPTKRAAAICRLSGDPPSDVRCCTVFGP